MVEEDSRRVLPVEGVDTTSAEENCRVWRLTLRWNNFWTSGWLVLWRFGGADVAVRVGNPHFIPACNPIGVGNIHYRGHVAEVWGCGCTTDFEFVGRRFWCVVLFQILTVLQGYYWNQSHKRSTCTCRLYWTSQWNGMFGLCRFRWKSQRLKKNLMGSLFDDFRWSLRLELLRLRGVGSL